MKHQIPDVVNGYELDEGDQFGLFDIVVPKATINLVKNPAMVTKDITQYKVGSGCAVSLTSDYQRRGLSSLKVVPTSGKCYVYYDLGDEGSLIENQKIYFSCDILGPEGGEFLIYATNESNILKSEKRKFATTGEWKRVWVGFTLTTQTSLHLCIEKVNIGSREPFYLDGFQCEYSDHVTTYCDGDQVGFIVGTEDYGWISGRSISQSKRAENSRSGGYCVNLKKIGFVLRGIIGLGMHPVESVALDLVSGAGMYQKTKDLQREFSLVGTIFGKDRNEIMKIKRKLIYLLSSKNVFPDQPILLKYCKKDENGFSRSKEFDIKCVYLEGLEGVTDNNNAEQVSIRFKLYDPYITVPGNRGTAFNNKKVLLDVSNLIRRTPVISGDQTTALWENMMPGVITDHANEVNVENLIEDKYTGYLYSGINTVIYWNGTTWVSYNTGISGSLNNIGIDSIGVLYAVTNVAVYYRRRGAASWVLLEDDASVSIYMDMLYVDKTKTLARHVAGTPIFYARYITGSPGYTQIGYRSLIRKSTFVPWGTAPTGTGATLVSYAVDENNSVIYLHTSDGKIYKTTLTGAWVLIGTTNSNVGGEPNQHTLEYSSNGRLYLAGNKGTTITYTNRYGSTVVLTYNIMAYWDGYDWKQVPVFGNDDIYDPTGDSQFYSRWTHQVKELHDGRMIASGRWISPKFGLKVGIAYFDDNNIYPLDLGMVYTNSSLNYPSMASGIYEDSAGRLYIGVFTFNEVAYSSHVQFPLNSNPIYNGGDAPAYPEFYIDGPMELDVIKNGFANKGIILDNLFVDDGEQVVITTGKFGMKMHSNVRGNMNSYISHLTNFEFRLNPGINRIVEFSHVSNIVYDFPEITNAAFDISFIEDISPALTDNGVVYFSYIYTDMGGGEYTGQIKLFSDSARTALIAHTTTEFGFLGWYNLIADGGSGIVGAVYVNLTFATQSYNFYMRTGSCYMLWKENHTSLTEGNVRLYNERLLVDDIDKLIIGEDNIL